MEPTLRCDVCKKICNPIESGACDRCSKYICNSCCYTHDADRVTLYLCESCYETRHGDGENEE